MNQSIRTNIFRLNQRQFILLLTKLVALKWLIFPILLLIVAVLVTCFTTDIRYAIVALMILFIIIPMLLAFLYISYGLLDNCYINIINHEMEFSNQYIKLIGHITTNSEYEDDCSEKEKLIERTIDWNSISRIIYNFNDIVIIINKPKFGFLLIPFSELQSKEEISKLLSLIKSKTKHE